jgi:hypothetical protein
VFGSPRMNLVLVYCAGVQLSYKTKDAFRELSVS